MPAYANMDITIKIQEELKRIRTRPAFDEKPDGVGTVRFFVHYEGFAETLLQRTKSLLVIVDKIALSGWLADEEWGSRLPEWFTNACSPSMSTAQAEEWLTTWRRLTREQQDEVEATKKWSLENWLYWMEPKNRQWFWWDAAALDTSQVILTVEAPEWSQSIHSHLVYFAYS
jgi:hypothetical protein